jgi:Co/Zn/Cd efflux system component
MPAEGDKVMETRALYPSVDTSSAPMRNAKRDEPEEENSWGFTNQTVLTVATASFLLIVISETIGAFAANSWSLLGDAVAMSVDVMSYFCNMVAERIKNANGGVISPQSQMILEVTIPATSVSMLIGVTIYVTYGAVQDIILKNPDGEDVDITMLWLFSVLGALVDIVSIWMFYAKGRSSFFETLHDHSHSDDDEYHILEGDEEEATGAVVKEQKNLNMISAFTHIGGDTLRTFSVFIAAAIATATNVPGYLCDAWAAVFVTVTIVITIMPLLREIVKAYGRIKAKMQNQPVIDVE